MPLQATSGAASYDAFGGGVPVVPAYIEEVFSCFLYTGNSSTQTITNNIDLSGKGGLVWFKGRNAGDDHTLFDTARGNNFALNSNQTYDQGSGFSNFFNFASTGFTLTNDVGFNTGGTTYVSWTFRKQPKFFDVVTWTGSGANTTIAHNLGSVPGSIFVKRTDTTAAWAVYHRSLANTEYLVLNTTAAKATGATYWNSTTPTSTVFSLGTNASVNASGGTYVAYLFAHDAGGFGLTGTDNVISCGSFTTDGSSNATVTLGYEPQWVMARSTAGGPWYITDNMRGMSYSQGLFLQADSSAAEASGGAYMRPTATGFGLFSFGPASEPYIYIAIRRGPMKVPTLGTSVFEPINAAGSTGTKLTTDFPVDAQIWMTISDGVRPRMVDRLRGVSTNSTSYGVSLFTNSTDAEDRTDQSTRAFDNTGFTIPGNFLGSGINAIYWNFKRAPSFFDEVCYTGTGSATTVAHNLGVAPELIMLKNRSAGGNDWVVYSQPTGNQYAMYLNLSYQGDSGSTAWNSTSPTSSVFSLGASGGVNGGGSTFVAYLFATCAGVSKCFSYTGNGSSQTINCGFTGGARWILIKRTDSTGDWYVWDSVRGIVSGNDPHLSLNTTAAEVTTDDTIDTDSTGFVVNQVSATNVNVSSATYIGLAIA